jgi:hypothetical protein
MSAAKKLWKVELEIACDDEEMEIEASTEEEAIQIATRKVETSTWDLRLDVRHATAFEIKYERPPGTDLWCPVAEEIRFAEDRHRYVEGDGCWWWTNGHAAVRCDLPVPPAARKVEKTIGYLIGDHKRDTIEFGPVDDTGRRAAKTDRRVVIDDRYARLIECGYPDLVWHVAEGDNDAPWTVPMLAYSGSELVGIVMGLRV